MFVQLLVFSWWRLHSNCRKDFTGQAAANDGNSTVQTLSVPVVPIKVFLEPGDHRQSTLIRISSSLRADAASLTLVQNFEDLFSLLKELIAKPGITADTPIIIAAKPNTSWDQVVNAYNASLRAKYKNVVFASWK